MSKSQQLAQQAETQASRNLPAGCPSPWSQKPAVGPKTLVFRGCLSEVLELPVAGLCEAGGRAENLGVVLVHLSSWTQKSNADLEP